VPVSVTVRCLLEQIQMTIEEIGDSLPNGFHDADIYSINIEYGKEEATFLIDVDLSSFEGPVDIPHREGLLKLTGLLYCVIEPPTGSFSKEYVSSPDKLSIASDSSDFSLLHSSPKLPEPLPDGSFRHWFFITSHNSFIYVAAMDASFEWKES
jgi:hypothetical protein